MQNAEICISRDIKNTRRLRRRNICTVDTGRRAFGPSIVAFADEISGRRPVHNEDGPKARLCRCYSVLFIYVLFMSRLMHISAFCMSRRWTCLAPQALVYIYTSGFAASDCVEQRTFAPRPHQYSAGGGLLHGRAFGPPFVAFGDEIYTEGSERAYGP